MLRIVTTTALLFMCGLAVTQPQSLDPDEEDRKLARKPFTKQELRAMLTHYKRYGLPLPEKGSKVVLVPQYIEDGGKTREWKQGFAFIPGRSFRPTESVITWGTSRYSLTELRERVYRFDGWRELSFDDSVFKTPRRSMAPVEETGADHIELWTFLIHLASLGLEEQAIKMFPRWYTKFSVPDFGWRDIWATPMRCVAEIGIDFAIKEWRSPRGDRRRALEVMTLALGDRGFAWEGLKHGSAAIGQEMRSALAKRSMDGGSPEAMLTALVEQPKYAGSLENCPPIAALLAMGERAIPALLARREDKTSTRVYLAAPFITRVNIGEIATKVLSRLPPESVARIESDSAWEVDYCRKNLLPLADGRIGFPDPTLLKVLIRKHPVALYRASFESLQTRPDIDPEPYFRPLAGAGFSLTPHAQVLIAKIKGQTEFEKEWSLGRKNFDPAQALASLLYETRDRATWKLVQQSLSSFPLQSRVTVLHSSPKGPDFDHLMSTAVLNDRSPIPPAMFLEVFGEYQDGLAAKIATVQNLATLVLGREIGEYADRELTKNWAQRDWDRFRGQLLQKLSTLRDRDTLTQINILNRIQDANTLFHRPLEGLSTGD